MAEAVVGKLVTDWGLDLSALQVLDDLGFGFTACISFVDLADDCRFSSSTEKVRSLFTLYYRHVQNIVNFVKKNPEAVSKKWLSKIPVEILSREVSNGVSRVKLNI